MLCSVALFVGVSFGRYIFIQCFVTVCAFIRPVVWRACVKMG